MSGVATRRSASSPTQAESQRVSGPAVFRTATFEGAPKPEYGITIVPRAIWSGEPERYEFSSLPPWWKPMSDTKDPNLLEKK